MPPTRHPATPAASVPPPPPDADWLLPGSLVSFPVPELESRRDGFYAPAPRPAPGAPILLFVHGMGGSFSGGGLKKAFLETGPARGWAVLSFNNAGAGRGVENEDFRDCLADIDAAVAFAARLGHRRVALAGHSTGCQKIAYWRAKRPSAGPTPLVFLAPADDYAVTRRDMGARKFRATVERARRLAAAGIEDSAIRNGYERFSPRRFLSVADTRQPEANVFRYAGPLTHFRRLEVPMLAVFGELEEFAAVPPADMLGVLRRRARGPVATWVVPGEGHSFRERPLPLAAACFDWLANPRPDAPPPPPPSPEDAP